MPEVVTEKSKKSDIWQAYHAAQKEVRSLKQTSRQHQQAQRDQTDILKRASEASLDGLVKQLTEVKLNLNKELDGVGRKMLVARQCLSTLEDAIALSEKTLKERHDIEATSDSLEALLLAQSDANKTHLNRRWQISARHWR